MKWILCVLVSCSAVMALGNDIKEGEPTFRGRDLVVTLADGSKHTCHRSEMGKYVKVAGDPQYQVILVDHSCTKAERTRQVICDTYWKPEDSAPASDLKPATLEGTVKLFTLTGDSSENGGIDLKGGRFNYENVSYEGLDAAASRFFATRCLPLMSRR